MRESTNQNIQRSATIPMRPKKPPTTPPTIGPTATCDDELLFVEPESPEDCGRALVSTTAEGGSVLVIVITEATTEPLGKVLELVVVSVVGGGVVVVVIVVEEVVVGEVGDEMGCALSPEEHVANKVAVASVDVSGSVTSTGT